MDKGTLGTHPDDACMAAMAREATTKTADYLKLYQKAINQIDDYFEYRMESQHDKAEVRKILARLTEELGG